MSTSKPWLKNPQTWKYFNWAQNACSLWFNSFLHNGCTSIQQNWGSDFENTGLTYTIGLNISNTGCFTFKWDRIKRQYFWPWNFRPRICWWAGLCRHEEQNQGMYTGSNYLTNKTLSRLRPRQWLVTTFYH